MDRCTYCGRRRQCWAIQRKGGGNYRRAGRGYWGRICGECVLSLLDGNEHRDGSQTVDRYNLGSLRRIARLLVPTEEGVPN